MQIGYPSSAWILFGVIAGFGIFAGAMVFLLSVSNRFRRSEYRGRTLSRKAGAAVGLVVALLIACIAYLQTWTDFYEIHLERDHARLVYYYPERTVDLPRERIVRAYASRTNPRSRSYSLFIEDTDGCTYASGPDDRALVDNLVAALR